MGALCWYRPQWRDKLDTLVEFPLTGLDMAPYVLSEQPEGGPPLSPSGAKDGGCRSALSHPPPVFSVEQMGQPLSTSHPCSPALRSHN